MTSPTLTTSPQQPQSASVVMQIAPSELWTLEMFAIPTSGGFVDHRVRQIRVMADLMIKNGYDQSKPLLAYAIQIEGKEFICVVDGNLRLQASLVAIQEGASFATVPVVVSPAPSSLVLRGSPKKLSA